MPSATTRTTAALLLALVALCAGATVLCGASTGLVIGLGGVVVLNGAAYWCSDRLVCALTRAQPLRPNDAPRLHALVADLAGRAGMPVPRIAVIDAPAPDALYTGRDPAHAVILVTAGLLPCLDARAAHGVLAHEMAHIRGWDTLLGTVAMTLAVASAVVAVVEQITALVGHPDADTLAQLLGAPLAALLLQRAVSRTREYAADSGSARLNGDALALTDALTLLARAWPPPRSGQRGERVRRLFHTHPPLAARIARLRASHPGAPPQCGVPSMPIL